MNYFILVNIFETFHELIHDKFQAFLVKLFVDLHDGG
jgi:hypothetical protein